MSGGFEKNKEDDEESSSVLVLYREGGARAFCRGQVTFSLGNPGVGPRLCGEELYPFTRFYKVSPTASPPSRITSHASKHWRKQAMIPPYKRTKRKNEWASRTTSLKYKVYNY